MMLARAKLAIKYTKIASIFPSLTLIEKLCALISLLLLSAFSGIYLYKEIYFLMRFDIAFFILLTIIICFFINFRFVLKNSNKKFLKQIFNQLYKLKLGHQFIVSILMHFSTLCAYLLISVSISNNSNILELSSLFILVMLGASIPISFAGWGPRELSAGLAFSFLSLDPVVGVTSAAIIGLLSLLTITFNYTYLSFKKFLKIDTSFNPIQEITIPKGVNFISFLTGYIVIILIGFQIRLPTDIHFITLNLGDPFAIVSSITFLTILMQKKTLNIWKIPYINSGFLCFLLMIAYGYILGLFTYGGNDWATYNRFSRNTHIIFILTYGSIFRIHFNSNIIMLLSKIFICSTLIILVLYTITLHILMTKV